MLEGWHSASKGRPCPVCHHTGWCIASDDGKVAICYRVESPKLAKSGNGWVHWLREGGALGDRGLPSPSVGADPRAARGVRMGSPDIAEYFAKLPQGDLQERMCDYLERELGLPKEIMRTLDWRWDKASKAVAIPMRDAFGVVTGIRYRALKTGAKWAKRGSKDGLFFDPEFIPYDAEELVVCEGPTDAAAAMACGFWCVGRSSCGTGRDLIRELIRLRGIRRVTIVADDDKPKPRPGGGEWRPGLEGAVRLAEGLGTAYRIVMPPPGFKDLREFYRAGKLDAVSFANMTKLDTWHGPGM